MGCVLLRLLVPLGCLWLVMSCQDEPRIRVDLRTDFVPFEEFTGVAVSLTTSDGQTVGSATVPVSRDDDYGEGVTIFSPDEVCPGPYLANVTLTNAAGVPIVTRTVALRVTEDAGFTILITRSSRACDPAACDPTQSCGVGPGCVDQACSGLNLDACGDEIECMEAADCQMMASCSMRACVSGFCFYRDRGSECDGDIEWCSPDDGCLPQGVESRPDAGMQDAGMQDGGELDATVPDASMPDANPVLDATPDADDGSTLIDAGTGDAGGDSMSADGGCPVGLDDCDDNGSCETPTTEDPVNCGGCLVRCNSATNADPACSGGMCTYACRPGWRDCDGEASNGCEVDIRDDALNCGGCNAACPITFPFCEASNCSEVAFASNGSEGPFAPTEDVVLSSGIHHFTTITIPAGVTVRVDGTGVLELRATGDIVIDGTVDLSGGRGASFHRNMSGVQDGNGGGGHTGTGIDGESDTDCSPPGLGGVGFNGVNAFAGCGLGGTSGGGAGSSPAQGGGGGGGPAGGGGGGVQAGRGGQAPGATAGAGTTSGAVGGGAEPGHGAYAGTDGSTGFGGFGGGGGSIGLPAVNDLACDTTFYPGSGGGGGAAGSPNWGSGGGGGGGALRIATPTQMTLGITGELLANGGQGGSGFQSGGSGSGGVIYIAAPTLRLLGSMSAVGGAPTTTGGAGGLGRIRISTLAERCEIAATSNPPFISGCEASSQPESVYVARFPE